MVDRERRPLFCNYPEKSLTTSFALAWLSNGSWHDLLRAFRLKPFFPEVSKQHFDERLLADLSRNKGLPLNDNFRYTDDQPGSESLSRSYEPRLPLRYTAVSRDFLRFV